MWGKAGSHLQLNILQLFIVMYLLGHTHFVSDPIKSDECDLNPSHNYRLHIHFHSQICHITEDKDALPFHSRIYMNDK